MVAFLSSCDTQVWTVVGGFVGGFVGAGLAKVVYVKFYKEPRERREGRWNGGN